jgi:predicted RND superfamily exporter protein
MTERERFFPRARRSIDGAFARWAGVVGAHPWPVIGACLLAVALIAPQARLVEVTTNPEEFLMPDHPIRLAYDDFKAQFGSDSYVLITIRHDDIFSHDFLEWLTHLHDEIEERVPYIVEVTSLVNVRSTRGEGDELIVEDLLDEWPRDEPALAKLQALVESTPFHRRTVLGDDGRTTSIQIEFDAYGPSEGPLSDLDGFGDGFGDDVVGGEAGGERVDSVPVGRPPFSGAQEIEVVNAIHEILDEVERADIEVYVAGTPKTNVRLFEDMGRNLILFIVLSTLVVAAVLGLVFRRLSGVILPLVVVYGSLAVLLGVIGLRGEPVNITIQVLPSFLLAVGTSSSIHLLVIFFQSLDAGASRPEALVDALGHAAAPITLACLTTAAGLASFLVAEIAPVQILGFMAPVGIIAGLILCLSLLPALLIVLPIRVKAGAGQRRMPSTGRIVAAIGDFGYRRPWMVLAGTAIVVGASCFGVAKVRFDHNMLNWFSDGDPIHLNTRITDSLMGGTVSTEIVIDTGHENGLHAPAFQKRLDDFERTIQKNALARDRIRKTISVNGVLKEIHQALHENDRAYYQTPDDRTLIAQELLLFENSGSNDLEKIVDSSFQTARLSVRSTWGSGAEYAPYLKWIEEDARATFEDATVSVTGLVPILMTSLVETEAGMKRSYAVALLTITPLMMILIGSLRGGLSSMVPNLAPMIIVMGLMGAFDVPFDVFTIMTGSVAIGLAVDDTIHFLHGFYREFERTGDTRGSIARTLETTGEALLTTSLVLAIGFSVFLFATMPTLQTFGLITTLAILLAFVADILVAPALVTVATRHRTKTG